MNTKWFSIYVLMLSIGLFLRPDSARAQSKEALEALVGPWVSIIGEEVGRTRVVFTLQLKEGELVGRSDAYTRNVKYPSLPLKDFELDLPRVRFTANPEANIVFEGKLDPQQGTLTGRLLYNDGSSLDIILTKYSQARLADEFPGLARLSQPYAYQKPATTDDGWNVATPEEVGLDEAPLHEMMQNAYEGIYGQMHSILIAKDGHLVLEAYLDGYQADNVHPLHSVTKSISSLLIGLAYDQGEIASCHEKVFDFFPEHADLRTQAWDQITVKHLLTMSAGTHWDAASLANFHQESKDYRRTALSKEPRYEPGEHWEYISPNVDLLAGVIKHATGMHADRFAATYLFEPLGITQYDWDGLKQDGYPLLDGSLAMRPRDMAKIGQLVLNKGTWKDKRILSEAWLEEATAHHMTVDETLSYGYLWWRTQSQTKPGLVGIFANGDGSQFILILPEYNIVSVTTGSNYDNGMHMRPLMMLEEYLMKASMR